MTQRDSEAYYDHHWRVRAGALSQDQAKREQIDAILRLVPANVRTVLDVGCGDGAITNALAGVYRVTAVDRSSEALKHLLPSVHAVRADAARLPFDDGSFDLVLTSEMLEHLPEATYQVALRELKRTARRYCLVSVPNDEQLRRLHTLCSACGYQYHIYLHFRSFSEKELRRVFAGWTNLRTAVCGVLDTPSFNTISYLRNKLAHTYFPPDGMDLICPACSAPLRPIRRAFPQKVLNRLLTYVEDFAVVAAGRRAKPDWLIALFEKSAAA